MTKPVLENLGRIANKQRKFIMDDFDFCYQSYIRVSFNWKKVIEGKAQVKEEKVVRTILGL